MYQIITLYFLNLHDAISQLYLNKAEQKREEKGLTIMISYILVVWNEYWNYLEHT